MKPTTESMVPQPSPRTVFWDRVLRVVLGVALVGGIAWAVTHWETFTQAWVQQQMENLGAWAPLGFMAVYVLATLLFLPGSILTLSGGALFGPFWGALYSLMGATLGATLAFLVARYLTQDWVARRAGGRLDQLARGVEEEGWRFVAFVRLVPLFPFNLLNYALGLTRIPLLQYVLPTFVCMAPGALAYSYLGYAAREALTGGEHLLRDGLIALGLLAAVAYLPRLIRKWRGPTPPSQGTPPNSSD